MSEADEVPDPTDPAEQPVAGDEEVTPSRPSVARRIVKALVLTVLIAIAIVVLFTTVFPWVEERTQDPTLGSPTELELVVQASLAPR